MKNIVAILCLLIASSVFVGCGEETNPEDTVKQYFELMSKKDFDGLKKISTTESVAMIDMLAQVAGMAPDKELAKPDIKKLECEKTKELATCTYCCDEEGKEDKIELKMVNGNWLIHTPKEMPNPEAEKEEIQNMVKEAADEVRAEKKKAEEAVKEK